MSSPHTTACPPPTDEPLEVSVVMPCLNEERTVGRCVEKALQTLQRLGIRGEVLVVDNGSSDGSVAAARQAGARVVEHPQRGYGNALRRGFDESRGRWIVMGDCDESYDFGEVGRFVERLRGGAELVMGNRLGGEIKPGAMPWLHRWIGNPGLTWFLNLLYRTGVSDAHCGLRGFSREACRRMNLRMPGMELASEMVIKASKAGLRIEEIPITLWPDGRGRPPHLRSFRDGWRHLRFMLLCSPVFLFLLPGVLLTLLGLAAIPAAVLAGYGVFDNVFGPNFMYTASLLAISGSHVLAFGFLARLQAHLADPVFEDPRIDKLSRLWTVERGLIAGFGLIAVAGVIAAPVLLTWWRTTTVPSPGQWIFAGTLFVLGLEAIFTSFLVSVVDLLRQRERQG